MGKGACGRLGFGVEDWTRIGGFCDGLVVMYGEDRGERMYCSEGVEWPESW